MLLGKYEHNLDEKQRLTIPSKLRNKLGQIIYVSKGFEGCLEIRDSLEFESWSKEIRDYSNANSDARHVAREVFANTMDLEIDKAGRIKIPASLLELAKISKTVFILGVGSKVEIWDYDLYNKYINSNEGRFEEIADKLGGAN